MKTVYKNQYNYTIGLCRLPLGLIVLAVILFTACSPSESNNYSLGGSLQNIPADIQITAIDNNNELNITFDPLTFIDGDNIFGVQFYCGEAGINFIVKDKNTTSYEQKVYHSGEYILYVSAITRAGTGTPREIPFSVETNLMLETLSPGILTQEVVIGLDDQGHVDKFYKSELYIEKNKDITLAGAIAEDDVIVNQDFFKRENTTKVKFLGESGIYSVYWNPVRKNVLIEPADTPIAEPDYFVFTGSGVGYPTTVSSEALIAAYGGGNGRFTTEWDPSRNILTRIIMRSVGTDEYQATISISANASFKPFSDTNWSNDNFAAENCTFTGTPILNPTGNWEPNNTMDPDAYYRIILNAATKAVNIQKVDALGNIVP